MSLDALVIFATEIAEIGLVVALGLVVIRLILGPTLPDRVIALDLLIGIVIGLIAVFSLNTGQFAYLDIAIALGLVGFLSTIAFARYVLQRGNTGDSEPRLPDSDVAMTDNERGEA
jgi:multicomponent Na+:H+ antiporter subunit F